MRGSIAAGSDAAIDAGLFAFKRGGNAIDAAIAAKLTATVSEPLLTGLCGAGIAVMQYQGQAYQIDMFTATPKKHVKRAMQSIIIDFGPTSQEFLVGISSVAVPTLSMGLHELHQRFARLPLELLVQPAVSTAKNGISITAGTANILDLLWPICNLSPELRRLMSNANGGPFQQGETYYALELANDLLHFAKNPDAFLQTDSYATRLEAMMKGFNGLTSRDLIDYKVHIEKLPAVDFQGAKIYTPINPSVGGLSIRAMLSLLDNKVQNNSPLHLESMESFIEIQQKSAILLQSDSLKSIATNDYKYLDFKRLSSHFGHTTHVSCVDEDGNAIGITSSLGSSCGHVIPGSGLLLNNFLGESDVAPAFIQDMPSNRLLTMCSPTIYQRNDEVMVMGSGGSSRIRSAIIHALYYSLVSNKDPSWVVNAPRLHWQDGQCLVETHQRNAECLQQLQQKYANKLSCFHEPNVFFGGLNMAGKVQNRFIGAGDSRRSGRFRSTDSV